MNEKKVDLGNDAREKLLAGIKVMYDAVKCTLGPMGKNVIIRRTVLAPVHITKDGVTVVRDIILSDPVEDIGVQTVKEAAMKTAEKAGDGTTTATVLAANIISKGIQHIKAGANSVHLKRGVELATDMAVDYVAARSIKIEATADEIRNIATISANNDPEIGALIAEGMAKVKSEGTIAVETSKTGETSISVVEGMKIDRGYVSPYFMTDVEKMQAVMNEPYILCADMAINNMQDIVPVLELVSKAGSSIVIIANDVEGEALSAMILNKVRGMLNVVAVKAPSYGEMQKEILKDIAAVCGAVIASPETGTMLAQARLGRASKVIVTKDSTTIINGAGNQQDIQVRIAQVRSQMEGAKYEHEKDQHRQRLARLVGGVAVMYVGAHTEIEMKEKKDRVDDALHATKAALEEGIIPGGGIVYSQAADKIKSHITHHSAEYGEDVLTGMKIMMSALRMPFEIIMENAGLSADVIGDKINGSENRNVGYDAKNNRIGDMLEMGIIDPAKVARIAIQTASSIAGTFLTTECVITPEKVQLPNQLPNK
jgi:chaperonin GroEL